MPWSSSDSAGVGTSGPRVQRDLLPGSAATKRRPGPGSFPCPPQRGPPASPPRSVDTAAVDLVGSNEHYGAFRCLLGERVSGQLHTRLGGITYGWTLSARSMGTTTRRRRRHRLCAVPV